MARPWGLSKINKDRLVDLLENGTSYIECAKEFGVSIPAIGMAAKKWAPHIHRSKVRTDIVAWNKGRRVYQKKYRKEHKDAIKLKAILGYRRRFEQNKEWLLSYLKVEKITCIRCGYNEFPCGIDEHHLKYDGGKNHNNFHHTLSVYMHRLCLETFQKRFLERDTIFLCSNCHRALHYGYWSLERLKPSEQSKGPEGSKVEIQQEYA